MSGLYPLPAMYSSAQMEHAVHDALCQCLAIVEESDLCETAEIGQLDEIRKQAEDLFLKLVKLKGC